MTTISQTLELARQHYRAGQLAQAEEICNKILQQQPDRIEALHLLGLIACENGEIEEGAGCYLQAIALQPNFAPAHKDLGEALLLLGEYAEGFAEYEWRWQCPDYPQRTFSQPLWDGSNLRGRTILLHAEPGNANTIQFIRYAPLVRDRGGRIIVECQPQLHRLLATVDSIEQLVPQGDPLPDFDLHAPLLSLPRIFGTTLETVPAEIPYIALPESKIQLQVPPGCRMKLGIAWGNTFDNKNDSDLPIQLLKLLDIPTVALYILDSGSSGVDLNALHLQTPVQDLSTQLSDLADTAAVLGQLDAIVTLDTEVAHLAGAMGVLVWLLLPSVPDWQWGIDGETCPWYPSVQLFRTEQRGDWLSLFLRVRETLSEGLNEWVKVVQELDEFQIQVSPAVPPPARSHQPKLVFRSEQVAIYDNFLPEEEFQQLFEYANLANYEVVHENFWRKVWRLHDGMPLRGPTVYYRADGQKKSENEIVYPTGTALDLFVQKILYTLPEIESLVGRARESWEFFSLCPWIYPSGSGLSLHEDGGLYSGGYTFFLHREWNLHWGGHLLVMHPDTTIESCYVKPYGSDTIQPTFKWLNDDAENRQVWDPGLATCILPKPNRIVFIAPHAFHMISRVDQNAGHHPRVSMAGFFVVPA